ncbi:hypothetical protein ACW2QC_03965 [Virgibacillus sp. FSP13]
MIWNGLQTNDNDKARGEKQQMAGLFLFGKPLKAADKVVGGANGVDKVRDAGKVDKGTGNGYNYWNKTRNLKIRDLIKEMIL